MTVLRCTAKLLKRLNQPLKPSESAPEANPLGEWYADIDVWRRQPFVVMLNAATGLVLVLPGDAAGLCRLNERALLQFALLCERFGLTGSCVDAELHGFDAGFAYAATRDRSMVSSLNQRKAEIWMQFEYNGLSSTEAAAREWEGLFQHPALGRDAGFNSPYHQPFDLARQRLMSAADIVPFQQPPAHGVH